MQHILRQSDAIPDWAAGTERRLGLSMLLASVLMLIFLSFLRFPQAGDIKPFIELVVELVRIKPPTVEEEPVAESRDVAPPIEEIKILPPPPVNETEPDVESSRDWAALAADSVQHVIDAGAKAYSVNPAFDERRRNAAVVFRPSEAPAKKPIWENVEKDVMGRTLLRHKNCYRVLDDPRVTNRWAFETFDQYITFCDGSGEEYLIEFDEITDRYAYLDDEASLLPEAGFAID